MKKQINLTSRLKVLAGLIESGSSVADIGTDHGYLPVYLAQTGVASRIIASDISPASLKTALKHAEIYGVADKITFTVTDGLEGVNETDVNTVVIAGVGGELIVNILSKAPWTCRSDINLILQPQSKIDFLFKFLYDENYSINQTFTVLDKKKSYTIAHVTGRECKGTVV